MIAGRLFVSHKTWMVSEEQYNYLNDVLQKRATVRPTISQYMFDDGHVPAHRQCQVTAMHLETRYGLGAQIGIQWLEKGGGLLPWPHVVNWVDEKLVDYSHPILEAKLGFTMIGNDVEMANALTVSIGDPDIGQNGETWVDPFLSKLHVLWYAKLKRFFASRAVRFDPFA